MRLLMQVANKKKNQSLGGLEINYRAPDDSSLNANPDENRRGMSQAEDAEGAVEK